MMLVTALIQSEERNYKIYDCFLFFNELELLDVRLNELYDHVDKFVLLEAEETFTALPKPFYYELNKDRYKKFADKIIHVKVERYTGCGDLFLREGFQGNQLVRGLVGCSDEGVILISDLDEIPEGKKLSELVQPIHNQEYDMLFARHKLYRFFFNRVDPELPYLTGTAAVTYGTLKKNSPCWVRGYRNDRGRCPAINHGWHFTSVGGFDRVAIKYESWSHWEYNTPEEKHPQKLRQQVNSYYIVPIDDSYPQYILDNLSFFKQASFIDEVTVEPEHRPQNVGVL